VESEVIDRGESILEKLKAMDIASFTFMDVIYVAGVIALVVLALKVVGKLAKGVFWVLAILLLLYWLYTLGFFHP
jgi:hypothetical protein